MAAVAFARIILDNADDAILFLISGAAPGLTAALGGPGAFPRAGPFPFRRDLRTPIPNNARGGHRPAARGYLAAPNITRRKTGLPDEGGKDEFPDQHRNCYDDKG